MLQVLLEASSKFINEVDCVVVVGRVVVVVEAAGIALKLKYSYDQRLGRPHATGMTIIDIEIKGHIHLSQSRLIAAEL